ncbi:MAG: glycerophosphodiester phosphodiesterase [Alphaproteobacteria bacterium]|jgi:glycerophosphoryl diester phosphodiesterase|nr:glycerophosphodiester phosphodiesterase [Alphaproteobacteria bacterium]MBT5161065.1 glycerophosphodiester phosphodiesterase [Alphaproteobacteria bacterium]MBT5920426.1 glycerophosphodiester phosphodiesterase [Alphaproteobacteria bacterium]MBT6387116.1 glycerophosphodiester phosphodiesterase [Alphaproteobacteria bacterium]
MTVPPYLDTTGPIALAHRGASNDQPENTMAAFESAVDLGFRYLETDVHVTRDGVLIAFHDDRLDRVTHHKGLISDLDWSEIKQARVDGQEPIPLLEDLFDHWPDLRINLDPKSDAVVAPLVKTIRDSKLIERICIGSFSGERLNVFRESFGPDICTSMGPMDVFRLRMTSLPFPAPFQQQTFSAQCVQVPLTRWGLPIIDNLFVSTAHKLGLKVHVWTINDETEMIRLLDLGVDGLISDEAKLLKSVFISRGIWA